MTTAVIKRTSDKLTSREIVILRSLIKRGGQYRPIGLLRWQRKFVVPLWRRGLIEVWYRQSLDSGPLHGPFYALTTFGAYLASTFLPAPRGSTGAEQLK